MISFFEREVLHHEAGRVRTTTNDIPVYWDPPILLSLENGVPVTPFSAGGGKSNHEQGRAENGVPSFLQGYIVSACISHYIKNTACTAKRCSLYFLCNGWYNVARHLAKRNGAMIYVKICPPCFFTSPMLSTEQKPTLIFEGVVV